MVVRSRRVFASCLAILILSPNLACAQFGEGGFRSRGSSDGGSDRGEGGSRFGGFDRGRSRSDDDDSDDRRRGFFGGPPPVDRIIGFMDRDRSGSIEPEEFERMPAPIRDAVESAGFDVSRAVSTEELIRQSDKISSGMRSFGEVRERGERSGADRSSSRGSSRRGTSEPAERPKVTVELPTAYTPHDANKDGQVAMHEWNRAKLAEFLLLDRNHDGFLTPRELLAAQASGTASLIGSASAPATPAVAPSAAGSPGGAVSVPAAATPAATIAAAPSTAAAERAAEAAQRRAGYVFGALDKDKDGKLSEQEWQQSSGTRASFEKAGVKLTFPVEKDAFVKAFPAG